MRAGSRHPWHLVAAVAVMVAGLAATPYHGVAAVVAAATGAAAALTLRPEFRPGALWGAGTATVVSLCASAAFLRSGVPEPVTALGYAEMAALTVMAGGLARWAPPRPAVTLSVAAGVAVVALVLRLIVASMSVSAVTAATACAIFSAGPVGAVACGAYLRLLEGRRSRAVAEARRDQRLELAQDLHDFVAHDVSAIVAQAQAGQLVAAGDPQRAVALFAGVEQAGLRALASMDEAVDALHPDRRGDRAPLPGLGELPELTVRYSAAGPAQVRLSLEPDLEVSREAATTAYRVVMEALTNVRRHAPAATTVDVEVRRVRDTALEVVVTNDLGHDGSGGFLARPGSRTGGLGLQGLAERVRALGGSLTAGPHEHGWRVQAVLPHRTGSS
ncbi:sensor histidine kinase [Streptosporangium carneum]|uniref:histidine kinase n=1 Tax=Streptosporangium carneum TaxID=47481 RepID=A0A9W6HWG6_9ACTN|nr:histidine kinase [Streptosporangium carneum]GLK06680.1 two-component sensor histidine kinase [Streptosporangium carneum]